MVAQPGSALVWGARGRWFESSPPDPSSLLVSFFAFLLIPSFLATVYGMKNSVVLTFASLLLLLWFLFLPKNHEWFNQRIIGYWNDFRVQKDNLGIEHRKVKRWGSDFTISKQISVFFSKTHNRDNILVLIPPSAYFAERDINYHVPEPAVFFYYTGIKTTWINSQEALEANWMVTANHGVLNFIQVKNEKMVSDSIAAFKKYPVSL